MKPFALSAEAFAPAELQRALCGSASGGYVSFEGWVRDHNDGRSVLRLEYEAYAALAEIEGACIVEEARAKFPIDAAACVHRTGSLEIGDIAVWVGVASGHRAEAFAACRYIIDEIKHRVPIWKKEHYTDGDSGWVNCEACASHAHEHAHTKTLEVSASALYARQMVLPEVGERGQAALGAARVLVVGAGGLGCAALPYLAAAGVGTIGICDSDAVDVSNLHRQILFGPADIGQPKTAVAARRLRAQNPLIDVREHPVRIDESNVAALLAEYDTVLDCTDNFEAKFLLNDACVAAGKLLIQASLYQFEGQLFVVRPEADAPCLRCLWPEPPAAHCIGNCAEVGVLGAVAGVLGTLQAQETLKHLLQLPGALRDAVAFVDLASLGVRRVRVTPRADCAACATRGTAYVAVPRTPNAPVEELEVDITDFDALRAQGFTVIDLRDPRESAARALPCEAQPVDATTLNGGLGPFEAGGRYLLVCSRGLRSKYLAIHLRGLGLAAVYSLRGGADALAAR